MTLGTPPQPVQFEARLEEASKLLGVPADELISIKNRPIRVIDTYDTDYMGSFEYGQINTALDEPGIRQLSRRHGEHLCEFENGPRFLYIEHESGPEIILHYVVLGAGAVSATAFAANQVLNLVNKICTLVQKRPARRSPDKQGRFMPVSIETRTKKGQRLIKQVGSTAKAIEKAVKSIKELTGE